MKKHLLMSLIVLGSCSGAMAQSAGSWLIQGGATRIAPNVSSGTLGAPSPSGTTIDVGSDTQLTGQLTYVYDDHVSVAVPLGLGFRHKLYGNGSIAGVGQIGTVDALPITVFAQYRFMEPSDAWRPYAMLGLSYVKFSNAQGSATLNGINPANPPGGNTGLSVDNAWGTSLGLGATVNLSDGWFVDVSWARTLLKTTATLSTGQKIDATLNPDMFSIGIGRRF
jgi:outer membrane protein